MHRQNEKENLVFIDAFNIAILVFQNKYGMQLFYLTYVQLNLKQSFCIHKLSFVPSKKLFIGSSIRHKLPHTSAKHILRNIKDFNRTILKKKSSDLHAAA